MSDPINQLHDQLDRAMDKCAALERELAQAHECITILQGQVATCADESDSLRESLEEWKEDFHPLRAGERIVGRVTAARRLWCHAEDRSA